MKINSYETKSAIEKATSSEKTIIKYNPCFGYTVYDRQVQYEFVAEKENVQAHYVKHKHDEKLSIHNALQSEKMPQMTDLCSAVIETVAIGIVYKDLQTVYKRSADPHILSIINQCYSKMTDTQASIDYFDEVLNAGSEYIVKPMQTAVTHDYIMVKDDYGKRHRRECIPFTTLEMTDKGRNYLTADTEREKQKGYTFDVDDLLQECKVSLIELYNFGRLKCVADIWSNVSYCYKCINKYIDCQRKKKVSIENLDSLMEVYTKTESAYDSDESYKNYEVTLLKGQRKDRYLDKFDKEDVASAIMSEITETLIERSKSKISSQALENISKTIAFLMYGYSHREIAEKLKIGVNQVTRYIAYVRQTSAIPEIKSKLLDILA